MTCIFHVLSTVLACFIANFPSGYRIMAFVPETPAPRGALRAAVTPSAGTHARALRPEPGRDSTPLFFRVARARPRRARARVLLTSDHFGGE